MYQLKVMHYMEILLHIQVFQVFDCILKELDYGRLWFKGIKLGACIVCIS